MKRFAIKRTTKQYIAIAVICVTVIGGASLAAYIVSTNNIRETYEAKLTDANLKISDNTRSVYIAKEDIPAGGILSEENTEKQNAISSQPQDIYITSSELGKKALIDITKGTQIIKSEVTDAELTADLREANFTVITNSANITNNDTVDVRLLYPNGENYIVLSKKTILDMSEDGLECYLWLSEEEIQIVSSAIVDAYLYEGTQIYTTEYIEPSIQEASTVTYTPSLVTMDLIKNDPNIVKIATEYLSDVVRKAIENRLAASIKVDVKETDWQIQNNQSEPDANVQTEDNYYYTEEVEDKKEDREYGE